VKLSENVDTSVPTIGVCAEAVPARASVARVTEPRQAIWRARAMRLTE
jgi:hypothetical protein